MKSFDFAEKAVMEVYEVAELESVLKIWVAHFLGPLGTIFPQNFGITPEQRVVRARESSVDSNSTTLILGAMGRINEIYL